MDIPNIMTKFGQNQGSMLLEAKIKPISVSSKDKEKELLNVFMNFNIDKMSIEFSIMPYDDQSAKRYNYFGNNPAAATQIYAARDVSGIKYYWFGRPSGVLKNLFDLLKDGELKNLLKECIESNFFDDNGINIDMINLPDGESDMSIDFENNSIMQSGQKISYEKFINKCIDTGVNSKVVLIIPSITKNNINTIISTHEDYIKLISESLDGSNSGKEGICHICGKRHNDINTKEYSSNFSKSSISKIFVTTTVNYAPMFSKINHQKNFGICRECYEKLMFGEKRIMSDYKIKIAREDCVILFNSLDKDIELENFYKIKDDIDIAFNTKETQEWTEMFKNEITDWQQSELYEFSIIFYKTDGKSCNIRKTIESISSIRFGYVINTFESIRRTFGERLKYFNLGNLYGIVPVSSSKDGEQLNILRLLNLYGAILKSESVSKNYIFDLACEALEKGLNELNSSKVHNYKNLYKIMYLKDKESGKDIYINKIMMSYIAFFHVLQKLKILDKEVFMDENKKKTEEVLPDKIIASEKFLDEQGFSTEARGLFYIGMLTHIIGVAQYKQGHKYKPILDKMTYSGMSNYDVMEFYLELVEKTRQYKKYVNIWLCERLEKKIHENLSDLEKAKLFNEKENVFFIMSGYAYCVEYSKKDNTGKDNNEEEKNND